AEHHCGSNGLGYLVGRGHSARAPRVEHSLRGGMGARGAAREALSESTAFPGEVARWDDSVNETPRGKRLRRQDGGCEHHLGGAAYADTRRNALGPTRVCDAAGHRLDLSDLTALRGPDQITGKTKLMRTGVALAVDQSEGRDRELLDRCDQRENGRLEFLSPGLVEPDEDRHLRPGREV